MNKKKRTEVHYVLFSCDDWRSADSMNINSIITVSNSLYSIVDTIHEEVSGDYSIYDDDTVVNMLLNGEIDNLYLAIFEG